MSNTDMTKNYFKVEKGTLYYVGTLDDNAFANFFKPGTYPYSPTGKYPMNGIKIVYFDSQGNDWSSDYAPGTQTGSNFTITASSDATQLFDKTMKVSATFNCKVYNQQGQSKTITNGKMTLYYAE
jgi:hypothetical protein